MGVQKLQEFRSYRMAPDSNCASFDAAHLLAFVNYFESGSQFDHEMTIDLSKQAVALCNS
jgi:hypothetical protein